MKQKEVNTVNPRVLVILLLLGLMLGLTGCLDEIEDLFPTNYTLTIEVEGQGTVDPPPGSHEKDEDSTVSLAAEPDPGWEFVEWIGDVSSPGQEETTVLMDGDKTVKVVFAEEDPDEVEYTLTIEIEGEGQVTPAPGEHSYQENTTVNLEADPDEGWEFLGWIGDVADSNQPATTITMDSDKTVTAQFEEEEEEYFAGGSGTLEDPYLIATPQHLNNVRDFRDKHFRQIADVDLEEYDNWQPIGHTQFNRFQGSYDGDGYVISNLTIDRPGEDYVGLFGHVSAGVWIKDVKLEDVDVTGNAKVGGLVGQKRGSYSTDCFFRGISVCGQVRGDTEVGGIAGNLDTNIEDSFSEADVTGTGRMVGGLVGTAKSVSNVDGDIINSYATGTVTGEDDVGGLVGITGGYILDSYATGDVIGSSRVGGLAGSIISGPKIKKCYARGNVSGDSFVGGLVGAANSDVLQSFATGTVQGDERVGGLAGSGRRVENSFAVGEVIGGIRTGGLVGGAIAGLIKHSYAAGPVSGEGDHVGGLLGYPSSGTPENSYYDKDTTGQIDEGKGEPRSTMDMKQPGTFEDWDFDAIWDIEVGETYPFLQWYPGGDPF